MNTERIDVLAVMASAHKVAEDYVRDVNDGCDCIAALVAEQVIEARAAVAELIRVAEASARHLKKNAKTANDAMMHIALSDALARVQGEKP